MQTLWQDVRVGVRILLKKPGFTLIAVLTLALGIGATTAIFSVVNAVLLRPLPFKNPERIVTLWENNLKDGIERDDVSPANFLDWRERSRSFEQMAFANPWSLDYTGASEPETWRAGRVSRGFFDLLGAHALVGRTFLSEEYEEGRNQAVVLSYGLWQRRFGGDAAMVGKTLTLDGQPMTVVGVMPADFKLRLFSQEELLWWPQTPDESMQRQRRATYLKVVARLKSGVTVEQARAEMDGVAANLAAEYPQTNSGVGVTAAPLTDHMTGRVRPALLLLFGAVALVLLIACANVANLLLARGSEREREFAIRAAIGAGRGRLVRQLMTESMLLALVGCAGGLLLAVWGTDLIVALSPDNISRIEEVRIDRLTLAFMLGVSCLTAIVFGLAPALQFSNPNLNEFLKEGGAASGGAARRRLRGALVVAEVALALVLLIGAGLLVRSFIGLLRADPGFAAESVVALQTFIWDRYQTPPQRAAFAAQAIDKLRSAPGVQAVGVGTAAPFLASSLDSSLPFAVEGRPAPAPGQEPTVFYGVASADYFASLGVPLKRGRLFNEFDMLDSPRVVIVNEEMARRHFPNEDPVGKKISIRGGQRGQPAAPRVFEIVGVVGNVRHEGLDQEPRPEYFQPYAQAPTGSIIFTVRTTGNPAQLIPALKARIWEINPTQPIYAVAALEDLISDSLRARRFSLALLGAFAALALVLAATGIYGVTSYAVKQRTREIGIRMALGADAREVVKLVVGQGLALTLGGVGLGLAAAFAATRLMASLLYGVSTTDPLTFAVVAAALVMVALVACYVPARRATRVDPTTALRSE